MYVCIKIGLLAQPGASMHEEFLHLKATATYLTLHMRWVQKFLNSQVRSFRHARNIHKLLDRKFTLSNKKGGFGRRLQL